MKLLKTFLIFSVCVGLTAALAAPVWAQNDGNVHGSVPQSASGSVAATNAPNGYSNPNASGTKAQQAYKPNQHVNPNQTNPDVTRAPSPHQNASQKPSQAAQDQDKPKKYIPFHEESPLVAVRLGESSSSLGVASIFYKKAGRSPNVKLWAKKSPRHVDALEIDKQEMFTREYNRIQKAFLELPEDTLVNVQSHVDLSEYSALQSIQVIKEFQEDTYFRYNAHGELFSIVPHNIERFHHLYITKERHNEMMQKNSNNKTFLVELIMKIKHVDAKEKTRLSDGDSYWLMLGEIAEVRIWTPNVDDPTLVWRYQAEWFQQYADPELMDLFAKE